MEVYHLISIDSSIMIALPNTVCIFLDYKEEG